MKITLFHLLLIATFLSLITTMERNDSSYGNPIKTRKDLISKMWRVEEVVANSALSQKSDFKNARFQFERNGTYTFTRKSGKVKGTWELVTNEQKLILDKGTPDADGVDILLLSEKEMYLSFTDTSSKTGAIQSVLKLKL